MPSSFFIKDDQVNVERRLMWIAPSPLLQSSFGVVSHELLKRLTGYSILYVGQNYQGVPRKIENYVLTGYSTGDHIIHYLETFKPDITLMYQSPPYLQRFNSMAKYIADRSKLVLYTPVESEPLSVDIEELTKNASLILVPSKWSQQCLRSYGQESKVLYHAVDTAMFKPSAKPQEFTLGCIASHVWRKGLERILDAHKNAETKGYPTRLLMVTTTYDEAPWMPNIVAYKDQIHSNALFSKMALMNLPVIQEEVAALYSQFHCHILTSDEAFGLPNLEAMATGTVPIIINHGASPEIVGDCGIYAKIESYLDTVIGKVALVNVEDLAEKIIWAKTHPQELNQLAQKGILRSKLFNWDNVTSILEGYLTQIV